MTIARLPYREAEFRVTLRGHQLPGRARREAARFTLAIAVAGAAMRLPAFWLRGNWRGLAVALGPGMLLMWLAGAAIAAVVLGLPLLRRIPAWLLLRRCSNAMMIQDETGSAAPWPFISLAVGASVLAHGIGGDGNVCVVPHLKPLSKPHVVSMVASASDRSERPPR